MTEETEVIEPKALTIRRPVVPVQFTNYREALGFCAVMVKSGFFTKQAATPEKMLALILAGQELGLAPMESIRSLWISPEGAPTLSAQTQLALFKAKGGRVTIHESTEQICSMTFTHPNGDSCRQTSTIEEAVRAGLANKSNWKNWPKPMLRWMCVREGVRIVGPDLVKRIYDADEMGYETDEEGNPVIEGDFKSESVPVVATDAKVPASIHSDNPDDEPDWPGGVNEITPADQARKAILEAETPEVIERAVAMLATVYGIEDGERNLAVKRAGGTKEHGLTAEQALVAVNTLEGWFTGDKRLGEANGEWRPELPMEEPPPEQPSLAGTEEIEKITEPMRKKLFAVMYERVEELHELGTPGMLKQNKKGEMKPNIDPIDFALKVALNVDHLHDIPKSLMQTALGFIEEWKL